MLQEYLRQNWIELLGTIISIIYIFLSIQKKIELWIFGFLSAAIYIIVFYQSKLYADMSLQFYYLAVSVIGWINWKNVSKNNPQTVVCQIKGQREYLQYIVVTIIIYIVYFITLNYLTDSPIPYLDSVIGALSVIATWMLTKKKIENWLLWIVADSFGVGLYFYRELYATSILFVFYTILAFVGYKEWKKSMNQKV